MSANGPFETLSTKTVYENPWMRVREDVVIRPDGSSGMYGIMESGDSVVIATLNERDEMYLIKLFSYAASAWSWSLPGGGDEGEHSETAAKRELAEETGMVASDWVLLGKTRIAGGLITERTSFYLARDLLFSSQVEADDKDLIDGGKFVTLDAVDDMIQKGEIDDCQTITGVYLVRRWLNENSEQPV
jgi:8-oxo-dGTP pyrophosphatase MutT (NUDIX family)